MRVRPPKFASRSDDAEAASSLLLGETSSQYEKEQRLPRHFSCFSVHTEPSNRRLETAHSNKKSTTKTTTLPSSFHKSDHPFRRTLSFSKTQKRRNQQQQQQRGRSPSNQQQQTDDESRDNDTNELLRKHSQNDHPSLLYRPNPLARSKTDDDIRLNESMEVLDLSVGRQPFGTNHPRTMLIAFYKLYAPSKLSNVDALLLQYKGKEEIMFRKLAQKYQVDVSIFGRNAVHAVEVANGDSHEEQRGMDKYFIPDVKEIRQPALSSNQGTLVNIDECFTSIYDSMYDNDGDEAHGATKDGATIDSAVSSSFQIDSASLEKLGTRRRGGLLYDKQKNSTRLPNAPPQRLAHGWNQSKASFSGASKRHQTGPNNHADRIDDPSPTPCQTTNTSLPISLQRDTVREGRTFTDPNTLYIEVGSVRKKNTRAVPNSRHATRLLLKEQSDVRRYAPLRPTKPTHCIKLGKPL